MGNKGFKIQYNGFKSWRYNGKVKDSTYSITFPSDGDRMANKGFIEQYHWNIFNCLLIHVHLFLCHQWPAVSAVASTSSPVVGS